MYVSNKRIDSSVIAVFLNTPKTLEVTCPSYMLLHFVCLAVDNRTLLQPGLVTSDTNSSDEESAIKIYISMHIIDYGRGRRGKNHVKILASLELAR